MLHTIASVLPHAVPAGLLAVMDPAALLGGLGGLGPATLAVVALIVFIESGLLFPFLPGDSLLFTAGLLHHQLNQSLRRIRPARLFTAGSCVGAIVGR